MENMTLGQRIRRLRKLKKLSQRGLAIKTNLSHSAISRFEADERTPSTATLQVLAKVFGVSTDFLLTGKEKRDKPLDDFQFALYDATKNLSENQKQDILKIVDILKKQGKE